MEFPAAEKSRSNKQQKQKPHLSQENEYFDDDDKIAGTSFAFLNISNPAEALTLENRKKVRQHVRYQVTAEVRAARQSQMVKSKRTGTPRAAVLESGETPFINVSHPSQIVAPHLVTFVRQQAQRKYKKETTMKKEPEEDQVIQQTIQQERFASFVSLPETQAAFMRFTNPTCLHISSASAIFPIDMNHISHEAVAYIHRLDTPAINHGLLPTWFKLFLMDEAAFLVLLQTIFFSQGMYYSMQGLPQPTDYEKMSFAYGRAGLHSVQSRLGDSRESQSIGVVVAITCLLTQNTTLLLNLKGHKTHKKGLMWIIEQRGGIETLNNIPGLRLVLMWDDIGASYYFGIPPTFPFPNHELPPLPSSNWLYLPSFSFLATVSRWRICNPQADCTLEQKDFPKILENFHIFNYHVQKYLETPADRKNHWALGIHMNAVILDLLSPTVKANVWSRGFSVEKTCRLAALAYLGEIRYIFDECYRYLGYHFVEKLRVALSVINPGWELFLELKLWCIVVGGALAKGDDDRRAFAAAAREVMGRLGLEKWEDVKAVLTEFIWIEDVFGVRCEGFGGEVVG